MKLKKIKSVRFKLMWYIKQIPERQFYSLCSLNVEEGNFYAKRLFLLGSYIIDEKTSHELFSFICNYYKNNKDEIIAPNMHIFKPYNITCFYVKQDIDIEYMR